VSQSPERSEREAKQSYPSVIASGAWQSYPSVIASGAKQSQEIKGQNDRTKMKKQAVWG